LTLSKDKISDSSPMGLCNIYLVDAYKRQVTDS